MLQPFSTWALHAIRYTGRWTLVGGLSEADLLTGYAIIRGETW